MMQSAPSSLRALFVAWQDPESRRYFPVGRLVSGVNHGNPKYEFAYLQGALEAEHYGFEPFPAFPDLRHVYRAERLFPFFANRLMSPNRPDYLDFVGHLNLPPDADEIEVLGRSGGLRATDALELYAPQYDRENCCYRTFFLAHGIGYLPSASIERVLTLQPGDRLFLMLDIQNPVDKTAIVLATEDRILVGYIPRYLLPDTHRLTKSCEEVYVGVAQVNPPPAPRQQRLLCRLESCWPADFQPFCTPEHKPIAEGAVLVSCGPDGFI
jgi:hypothetical protein